MNNQVVKSSRLQILPVIGLLLLLGTLAFLQYRWLNQISEGERQRMHSRLQSDTQRFADDFNLEIQNIYFNLQINAEDWQTQNLQEFNERYNFWLKKTAYPQLIQNVYFLELTGNSLAKFNADSGDFTEAEWTENLAKIKPQINSEKEFQPLANGVSSLLIPVSASEKTFNRVMISPPNLEKIKIPAIVSPKRIGTIIVELNAVVIQNQLLPDLKKRYFFGDEDSDYDISIVSNSNQIVYQTINITSPDSKAELFALSPEKFLFYSNRQMMTTIGERKDSLIVSRIEKNEQTNLPGNSNSQIEIRIAGQEKPRVSTITTHNQSNANWTLNVQHVAGSLDNFIAQTKLRNMLVSFGILSLLGIAGILIFISAQRAKVLAQRQIDFVSSVSHEFRTPLAVIYSAGENLADGVAKETTQVSKYGNLIKGEGKKLTAMVEQILDFAGANSGKKKYDLREHKASEIIENAIAECKSFLQEENFELITEISENLPKIHADKTALSHAIQNLIVNGIKYSNGSKSIKIDAFTQDRNIIIAVEDKGIGIDKKDLPHIFEPFYRSKKVVDEQIHGNGLGLSLVKQIVEAHGGKVVVESEMGKGSKFVLQLPSVG